jgi:predicted ABC-type ATPase
MPSLLDRRPLLVAVAGPNGAGKTTFYHSTLKWAGLALVNADNIARELHMDAYEAARAAAAVRDELVRQRESFVFETVFSDPAGAKLAFLERAADSGYTVVLCFIGLGSPELSRERVAQRVTQGGHDVPTEKILARFPRTLANLGAALRRLSLVRVYDNSDLRAPYRLAAVAAAGRITELPPPVPPWLKPLLPTSSPPHRLP